MRPETKHSIILVAGTGTTAVLSMVYSFHVGRQLGPALFADFATVISLTMTLALALGPINGVVTRFTAQYACHNDYGKIRTLYHEIGKRVLLIGAVAVVAGVVMLGPLGRWLKFDSSIPLLFALGITYLSLMLNVPRGVLRGVQWFGSYNINTVTESLIRLAAGVALLHFVCGVAAALSAYVVALAAIVIIGHRQARRVWNGHAALPVDGRDIKSFSAAMIVFAACGAGFQNIDMLMAKHYFADAEAGQYAAAFTLARAMAALVTPFGILSMPLISSLHERSQPIAGTLARVCAYFLLLAAVPMLLFAIWPDQIVVRLYGADFSAAGGLLSWLAAARLLGYVSSLLAGAHVARGDFRFLFAMIPVLGIEVVGLAIFHDSLTTVVWVVGVSQALRLSVVLAFLIGPHLMARGPAKRK